MTTAYFTIVYQPFLPWKHTERTIHTARERGFETVVAWDDRNSRSDYERIRTLADTVVPFTSPGHCGPGYDAMRWIKSDFALILGDDEQPSEPLWDLAARPPSPNRFGIPVLPVVGDKLYQVGLGIQERLGWVDGWTYRGGFEGMFDGAPLAYIDRNPGVVIWHYLLDAPREEREAKAARYTSFVPGSENRSRLIYEEHLDRLVAIPGDVRRYLPLVETNSSA